jgi:type I restriction enzyme S subunit
MANNWKKYKLIDVINLIGGGTPKTTVKEYWDGDIPWLSVVDFNNGQKRVYDTEKKITELGLKNSSTKILKTGQLIISARGTVGVLSVLGRDMSFNQSCYGLDAKSEYTINDFLYYLVEYNIKQIKSNSYGSVFDTITTSTFQNIDITLPPLPEQQAIAEILSSLDDKIELNLQTNKTLEEMANALFKNWFIDFQLASVEKTKSCKIFGKEELTEIPLSYQSDNIKNLITRLKPEVTYKKEQISAYGAIPIYDQSQDGVLGYHNNDYSFFANEDAPIIIFGDHTCKLELITTSFSLGPNTIPFMAKKSDLTSYLFFSLRGKTKMNDYKRHWSELMLQDIILPPDEHISKFNNFINPWLQIIESNKKENQILKQTRDYLLPKLISGEIRVKEAAKKVKEVL